MPWADPSQCERLCRPGEDYHAFLRRTLQRFLKATLELDRRTGGFGPEVAAFIGRRDAEWQAREAALISILAGGISQARREAMLDQWQGWLARQRASIRRG